MRNAPVGRVTCPSRAAITPATASATSTAIPAATTLRLAADGASSVTAPSATSRDPNIRTR